MVVLTSLSKFVHIEVKLPYMLVKISKLIPVTQIINMLFKDMRTVLWFKTVLIVLPDMVFILVATLWPQVQMVMGYVWKVET